MAPICCEDLRLKGEKKPKPRSFPLSRRRNTQSSPPPRMQISPSFPGVEWKRKWLVLFFYQVLASDKRDPSKESPGQTTRSISTEDLVSRFQLPNLFSWLDRLSSTVLNLVTFNLDQSIPLHCTSEAIPSCSKVLGTFCHTYNGVKLKCYSLLPPILRGGEEGGGGWGDGLRSASRERPNRMENNGTPPPPSPSDGPVSRSASSRCPRFGRFLYVFLWVTF